MVLCMCGAERRVGEGGACEGEAGSHVAHTALQLPAGLKLRVRHFHLKSSVTGVHCHLQPRRSSCNVSTLTYSYTKEQPHWEEVYTQALRTSDQHSSELHSQSSLTYSFSAFSTSFLIPANAGWVLPWNGPISGCPLATH